LKASRCGPRLSNTPRVAVHSPSRRSIDLSAGFAAGVPSRCETEVRKFACRCGFGHRLIKRM
jgi:hypothetical protein